MKKLMTLAFITLGLLISGCSHKRPQFFVRCFDNNVDKITVQTYAYGHVMAVNRDGHAYLVYHDKTGQSIPIDLSVNECGIVGADED